MLTSTRSVIWLRWQHTTSVGYFTAIRVEESGIATSTIVSHTLSIRVGGAGSDLTRVDCALYWWFVRRAEGWINRRLK